MAVGSDAAASPAPAMAKAAAALEVAAELVDELVEAHTSLGTGYALVCFGNRRRYRQCVADEERDGFDQDGLVAFEAIELVGQAVESRNDRGFASVGPVRRQVGRERCRDDRGLVREMSDGGTTK